ncbi:hypothetical protein K474DRAFT_1664003 [Panus rudis PR-1116 ss-1]|nr:hypothetical protein K474DRAFT_1664003 [Panus rudis PR-1116 ss-1]
MAAMSSLLHSAPLTAAAPPPTRSSSFWASSVHPSRFKLQGLSYCRRICIQHIPTSLFDAYASLLLPPFPICVPLLLRIRDCGLLSFCTVAYRTDLASTDCSA